MQAALQSTNFNDTKCAAAVSGWRWLASGARRGGGVVGARGRGSQARGVRAMAGIWRGLWSCGGW
jgi:hypothetical protein